MFNFQIHPMPNPKGLTTTTTTNKLAHHNNQYQSKPAESYHLQLLVLVWLPNKPKGNLNHKTQNNYSNSPNVPKSPFSKNKKIPTTTDLITKTQMPECAKSDIVVGQINYSYITNQDQACDHPSSPLHTSIFKFLRH